MNTVANIREIFKTRLNEKEFVRDKSGVDTIEIIGASFIADEPLIFGGLN